MTIVHILNPNGSHVTVRCPGITLAEAQKFTVSGGVSPGDRTSGALTLRQAGAIVRSIAGGAR